MLEEAERGLRIMPLDRVVEKLSNFDRQRDSGRPDPERSRLAGVILPDGMTAFSTSPASSWRFIARKDRMLSEAVFR